MTDFEAMRKTDDMITEMWLNGLAVLNGYHDKYFFDMYREEDIQKWKAFMESINGY